MNKLISKYQILKENKLIIEVHSGSLDITSFIKFKTTLQLTLHSPQILILFWI